jgi:hypothetical protein
MLGENSTDPEIKLEVKANCECDADIEALAKLELNEEVAYPDWLEKRELDAQLAETENND